MKHKKTKNIIKKLEIADNLAMIIVVRTPLKKADFDIVLALILAHITVLGDDAVIETFKKKKEATILIAPRCKKIKKERSR